MTTVQEHYNQVLADVYSWIFNGFEQGISKNIKFLNEHHVSPTSSAKAIDLGAGCGFQSIPLAKLGFTVTAIDLDRQLLDELEANCTTNLAISTIQDDLINFEQYINTQVELITCMTDTLLHLESPDKVISLLRKVFSALEDNGKFIITFRDLSVELSELDRFITIKSDEQTIFTCFLEYEPDTVKVHDLIYQKNHDSWKLNKSFYRKLRLSKQWVDKQLSDVGFNKIVSNTNNGLVTLMAVK